MILLVVFICAFFFLWVQGFLFKKYWSRNLDVTISIKNTECTAGEENILTEVITNNKCLPLPLLHVKFNTPKSFRFENEENSSVTDFYYRDDIFAIMGHQSITRNLKFTCESRGCYYLRDTGITSTDLFMRLTFTDKRTNNIVIHVYPKKVNLDFFEIPFETITGSFATQKNLIEDPFEFRGIREYQPFDSMHNINWKSSAKNDLLQVNTYFMTSSQEVRSLLNLDTHLYSRDDKLLEKIISLASSLAEKFISAGIPTALDSNAVDLYTHERLNRLSGSGINHMVSIDTALARIDTHGKHKEFITVLKENFECIQKNAYYIIISNNRQKDILDYYNKIKETAVSCYFIIPELKQFNIELSDPGLIKWDIEY